MKDSSAPISNDQILDGDVGSVDAVFEALQGRLPPPNKRIEDLSELDLCDARGLNKLIEQDKLVIASYTNSWLTGTQRFSDVFVTWTFSALGILLALIVIGGTFSLLPNGNNTAQVVVFIGIGVLGGLGIARKYALILPPMQTQSITVINGKTRELIYACRIFNDKRVDSLVRVPISDFAITISWTQIADHTPSFLSIFLRPMPLIEEKLMYLPSLCIATVNHTYPAPVPKELAQNAKNFADALGAKYLGLEHSPN